MKSPLLLAALALCTAADRARTPRPTVKHPPKAAAATKPEPSAPVRDFFQPSETRSTGALTVGGQPIAYDAVAGTLVVHAKDWEDTDAVEADADKTGQGQERAQAPSVDVLHGLFQAGRARRRPADHLPVQRRPGLVDRLAAHGRVRPGARADRRHAPHAAAPYSVVDNDQSLLDVSDLVFIDAPGTGFSPHRRQGQGEGLLRRRPGRRRVRRIHHPVPDQIRPLELAQICVRRKLRDDARGGARARAAEGATST